MDYEAVYLPKNHFIKAETSCWKSRMQVDDTRPLRLCKHCQKVFMSSRANAVFLQRTVQEPV